MSLRYIAGAGAAIEEKVLHKCIGLHVLASCPILHKPALYLCSHSGYGADI